MIIKSIFKQNSILLILLFSLFLSACSISLSSKEKELTEPLVEKYSKVEETENSKEFELVKNIDQGIETTLSQSEYSNNGKVSEAVEVVMKNTTEETYFFYTPACASDNPLIEPLDQNNILQKDKKLITISPPCDMMPFLAELKPEESFSFTWNQVDYSNDEQAKFVNEGEYRMIIRLYKQKEGNHFNIKTSVFKITYNKPNLNINVESPTKGSLLKSGEKYTIEWMGAESDKVNIYYGVDWRMDLEPEQKQELAINVPNTGNYQWLVPNLFETSFYGQDYIIKIEEVDDNGIGYSQVFNFKKTAELEVVKRLVKIENRQRFSSPEMDCLEDKNKYIESKDYSNKGFSACSIIDLEHSYEKKKCSWAFSPDGCYICTLECK